MLGGQVLGRGGGWRAWHWLVGSRLAWRRLANGWLVGDWSGSCRPSTGWRPTVGQPVVGRPRAGTPGAGLPRAGRPCTWQPYVHLSWVGRLVAGWSAVGRPQLGYLESAIWGFRRLVVIQLGVLWAGGWPTGGSARWRANPLVGRCAGGSVRGRAGSLVVGRPSVCLMGPASLGSARWQPIGCGSAGRG